MTRILNSETSECLAPTGSAPAASPKATPDLESAKPVFSLSRLKITKPRTAADIQRALAQGRVSELKPD